MLKHIASVLTVSLLLAGCGLNPPKVSLTKAISSVQADLVTTNALPISNYGTWQADLREKFEAEVHLSQCTQHTSDPIVPIIAGTVSLSLAGEFTQSGNFAVSSILTSPGISVGGSGAREVSQGLTVPISFAALSSIPSVEEGIEATRMGTLLHQNDKVRGVVGERIIAEREAFMDYVQGLIVSYNPIRCTTTELTSGWKQGPLMGTMAPKRSLRPEVK